LLKEILQEAQPLIGKEWEYAAKGYMPLTPSILKNFETKINKCYHICSIEDLPNLYKLQNKRKDISAFTIGSKGLANGVYGEANILVELEGYTSFHSPNDLESLRDRNGLKWLRNDLVNNVSLYIRNNFSVKIWKEILDKYDASFMNLNSKIANLSNKEKANFIKNYFDLSKKIINKKLLNDIKELIQKEYQGEYTNDELLLHNFKILKWYYIENDESYNEIKNIINKLSEFKNKYGGFIPRDIIEKINPDFNIEKYAKRLK